MKFSYSAVWDDTVRMLKSHGSVMLALAGVFFLLPGLLIGYLFPSPAGGADPFGQMIDYYREDWPWLLLGSLINSIGAVSIYLLLFDGRGRTVGSALGAALPIVPFYFLMSVFVSLALGLGFAALVLPGIYLVGRLATSGIVMVAEGRKNPLDAIRGSWRMTRGRGWAIAGILIIVAVAGMILSFAITAILGSVFILVAGREGVGGLLVLILNSALTAVLYTVLIVLLAAIYRSLKPAESASAVSA